MRKSTILKNVLAKKFGPYATPVTSDYICLAIKSAARDTSKRTQVASNQLIKWIEDSLHTEGEKGSIISPENRGVASWLYHNGHINARDVYNQFDQFQFYNYRRAWLQDMILYWEEQEAK